MPIPGPNVYAFDSTGTLPANKIENEIQTITAVNNKNYHYIVPFFAPFYGDSIIVEWRATPTGTFIPLTFGVDYNLAYPYLGASLRADGKVYGAVSFVNLELAGQIRFKQYQTVGGEFTLDLSRITEITANLVYNPRITSWEQVSGAPAHFPPHAHAWTPEDVVGQGDLLDVLLQIRDALLTNSTEGLLNHIRDKGNPHRVNKFQINLGNVQNYPTATIAEMLVGEAQDRYATPKGVKEAIAALDTRQYVTLQEVLQRNPVPKVLTFDMFLQFMKVFGVMGNTDPVEASLTKPTILYPTNTGVYISAEPLRCLPYTGTNTGSVAKSQNLSGIGNITLPAGVNSVKITGRGAVGTTTTTGGSMVGGSPIVTPSDFEARVTLSQLPPQIVGSEGSISVKVVSSVDDIDETLQLNLVNSNSTQRVYSTSFPLSVTNGIVSYASITVVYTGTQPTITNVAGANAVVTLLSKTLTYTGSPNSTALPERSSNEVILDVNATTPIQYNCPGGTDVVMTWFEPMAGNGKIQTDTEWEISRTPSFVSTDIIDSTALGKGTGFTLTAWKPTRNAMIDRSRYYVRCRWKFNNNTTSDWSTVHEFSYQATNIYPTEGTPLGYYCVRLDQWGNFADGKGGITSRIVKSNAVECGYDPSGTKPPINVSMLASPKVTITKPELVYIQNGGTHPFQITIPVEATVDEFIQNIEDDRVRLYLKDSFYQSYLTYKNGVGADNVKNFRIPYTVKMSGQNQDVKIELVANMSPNAVGRVGLAPSQYYVKVMFNNVGYNTSYEDFINKTTIDFSFDTVAIFNDGTGEAFKAQSLTPTAEKNLTATLVSQTLISYKP